MEASIENIATCTVYAFLFENHDFSEFYEFFNIIFEILSKSDLLEIKQNLCIA